MESFSERFAKRPARAFQLDSMDDELRNGLWNAVHLIYFAPRLEVVYGGNHVPDALLKRFMTVLWNDVMKRRVDEMGFYWDSIGGPFRIFFNTETWDTVYGIVEFIPNHFPDADGRASNMKFLEECNRVLKRELSAYRFVGRRLAKLTDENEIQAIEEARNLKGPMKIVENHLASALQFLSDRKQPNYRNSIKESISAVESYCSLLAGKERADLNGALQVLEAKGKLHPALKKAFNSLYGYTSDADGIRHALLEESTLTFDDAKFMLVSCSAFINYVKALAPALDK